VSWYRRPFDGFRNQWRHAFDVTGIETPWALALDADMRVTPALAAEIGRVIAREDLVGGVVGFDYAIRGRVLSGSFDSSSVASPGSAPARGEAAPPRAITRSNG
jgi:hypothetical protein